MCTCYKLSINSEFNRDTVLFKIRLQKTKLFLLAIQLKDLKPIMDIELRIVLINLGLKWIFKTLLYLTEHLTLTEVY